MAICAECVALTNRNYEKHGDERFPPVECAVCGGRTTSGGCLLHQVCPDCSQRDGVCEGCGNKIPQAP